MKGIKGDMGFDGRPGLDGLTGMRGHKGDRGVPGNPMSNYETMFGFKNIRRQLYFNGIFYDNILILRLSRNERQSWLSRS